LALLVSVGQQRAARKVVSVVSGLTYRRILVVVVLLVLPPQPRAAAVAVETDNQEVMRPGQLTERPGISPAYTDTVRAAQVAARQGRPCKVDQD
jgi:hypothetical protein